MKARYAHELTVGSRVDSVFVIRSKEVRAARNGDAYLALTLSDRSGLMPAVLFRPARLAASAPIGCVVRVSGSVTTFRGTKRISVESMVPADSWDRADLVAHGTRPVGEMTDELSRAVRSVGHPGLRALLESVFGDEEFFGLFASHPASQAHHHAYLGGLLEHTLSVATTCASLATRYEGVDRDLLLTAAVLHDIGKVDELDAATGIARTDQGRLLGHVMCGVTRVHAHAARVRLAPRLARLVEHAILSHHGEPEGGSLRRPATIEALLLQHVDGLDVEAAAFLGCLSGAARADECWTDSDNPFGRSLYAPRAAVEGRLPAEHEDEGPARLSA